jgi:hypothetical protein
MTPVEVQQLADALGAFLEVAVFGSFLAAFCGYLVSAPLVAFLRPWLRTREAYFFKRFRRRFAARLDAEFEEFKRTGKWP